VVDSFDPWQVTLWSTEASVGDDKQWVFGNRRTRHLIYR